MDHQKTQHSQSWHVLFATGQFRAKNCLKQSSMKTYDGLSQYWESSNHITQAVFCCKEQLLTLKTNISGHVMVCCLSDFMVCCLSDFLLRRLLKSVSFFDFRVLFFSLLTISFSTALSFVGMIFDILVWYSTLGFSSFKTFHPYFQSLRSMTKAQARWYNNSLWNLLYFIFLVISWFRYAEKHRDKKIQIT